MYTTAELILVKGLPSTISLGNTGVTDPVPTAIDFLSGVFSILDVDGETTWRPSIAQIKNGGTWSDSATMDGRQLVASRKGNVIETLQLVAHANTHSAQVIGGALSEINLYANAASEFWEGRNITPVYLRWRADSAPGEQYALVFSVEVDIDWDGVAGESCILTLSLEREAAWRPIPPGAHPKIWGFYTQGLIPYSGSGAAPAGYYKFDTVYAGTASAFLLNYDEINTGRLNYLNIDAAKLPGDAPALAYVLGSSVGSEPDILIARSTIRDLYPLNDNNSSTQRMRNTFNGGDATVTSPTGITGSKPVDAVNGLLSNGSTVTRYVARAVLAAGGATNGRFAVWTRALEHYNRRWAVFARMRYTAGTPANVTVRAAGGWSYSGTYYDIASTSARALTGLVLNQWQTFYLGELNLSAMRSRYIDDSGMYSPSVINIALLMSKTNDGVAATVEFADLVFMPLDEPMMKIEISSPFNGSYVLDNSGYSDLPGYNAPTANMRVTGNKLPTSGQSVTLVPNVINRIYVMRGLYGGFTGAGGSPYQIAVYVLPRWYGVRDL